jgi:hypothetical protein
MVKRDEQRLNHQLDRLERGMPQAVRRPMRWLREPSSRWLRIPVGLLLLLGGVFSILPLLGIWMLPLGLLLLAQDIPFLRRPTRKGLLWTEKRWIRRRYLRQRRSNTRD